MIPCHYGWGSKASDHHANCREAPRAVALFDRAFWKAAGGGSVLRGITQNAEIVSEEEMTTATINIKGLVFLVADANPYFSRIIVGLLRSFGANAITEVRNSFDAIQMLSGQKIDILLCDDKLPPHGGLQVTYAIRHKRDNENRTIPILIMSGDTRESLVKIARDAGASMVMAKPVSATSLYDRLTWIAFTPRQFVETPTYFGPDRRFKNEGGPNGVGRRKTDKLQGTEAAAQGQDLTPNRTQPQIPGDEGTAVKPALMSQN
jgi:CheY-like chemotaxis protein